MNQAFKACRWCGQPATTRIEIAPVVGEAQLALAELNSELNS